MSSPLPVTTRTPSSVWAYSTPELSNLFPFSNTQPKRPHSVFPSSNNQQIQDTIAVGSTLAEVLVYSETGTQPRMSHLVLLCMKPGRISGDAFDTQGISGDAVDTHGIVRDTIVFLYSTKCQRRDQYSILNKSAETRSI